MNRLRKLLHKMRYRLSTGVAAAVFGLMFAGVTANTSRAGEQQARNQDQAQFVVTVDENANHQATANGVHILKAINTVEEDHGGNVLITAASAPNGIVQTTAPTKTVKNAMVHNVHHELWANVGGNLAVAQENGRSHLASWATHEHRNRTTGAENNRKRLTIGAGNDHKLIVNVVGANNNFAQNINRAENLRV